MKAIFIGQNRLKEVDFEDLYLDDEFVALLSEFNILESHIVYFSAGDAKIKEILIKKDPSISV
jgi:hypothetical protein